MSIVRPLVLAAALVLGACTSSDGDSEATVVVFAAASLTDAFTDIAAAFEAAEPGIGVQLSFAGSAALREQVLDGAPADVIATANRSVLGDLVRDGALTDVPEVFALNELRLAVPAGNPAGVSGPADLTDDDLLVGLCGAQVPCGALAREALALAGVEASVDTEEADVRSLLAKLAEGELDAGIVYASDIVAADGRVEAIDAAGDLGVLAAYPIAVLDGAPNPDAAETFVAFVRSDEGQQILGDAGFRLP